MADAWLPPGDEDIVIANAPLITDPSDPYAVICQRLYRFPWLLPPFVCSVEDLPALVDQQVYKVKQTVTQESHPRIIHFLSLGIHGILLNLYSYIRDLLLCHKNDALHLAQPHLTGHAFFRHEHCLSQANKSPHDVSKAFIRVVHALVLGDHLRALITPTFDIPEGPFTPALINDLPAIPYRHQLPDKKDPRQLPQIAAIVARSHEVLADPLIPPQLASTQSSPLLEAQAQVAAMTKTKELCYHLAGGPSGRENNQSKFAGIAALGLLFDSCSKYASVSPSHTPSCARPRI